MGCYKPLNLKIKNKYQVVPCGRCIGCRLERSRQWAIRCINEASMHQKNSFVTLTYRDEELVYGKERPTLYPRHLELFWKRLREKYGHARYFACGEYGERTARPHYHACIFGLDFEDKKICDSKDDINYYRSDELDNTWTHGHCIIGDVTFDSAAYVARYIMKKKLGKTAHEYEDEGIVPEFARMSRRPGIGLPFLETYSGDIFNHGYQVVNGHKVLPPRYYQNKFKENEPDIMAERTRVAKDKNANNIHRNTFKRLKVAETVKIAQIKNLTRKLD